MKVEIKIPSMGESISQATIGTIIKQSGSAVEIDDEIVELETDKVNQVLHAPEKGVVTLNVASGDVVKIGQVIGYVDSAGETKSAPSKQKIDIPIKESKPQPETQERKTKEARYTAESMIQELKNGSFVTPSNEEKKFTPEEKPARSKTSEGKRESRSKMSSIRKVIAKRLVESQQTTAMLTTFNEVDMSQIISLREKYKEAFIKEFGVKLGFMSFFVKACTEALKLFPYLNSYIEGDEIVHREYYDINVAVSTDKGVLVPVIRNCDQLSFADIERIIEQQAKKARDGTLTADDLSGGGFTITNGGVFGSLLSTPIINPPQTGILGMHKIEKRPVVIQDKVEIRAMMYLALSYDHRIIDGKEAVTFLVTVKNFLEDPSRLLLGVKG
jgi:2-oxoglutarate dehydrogenase E2 component (dihydrolipoamide succinyltransferase)